MSRSQSRSHVHLICVLPHGFSSKRETVLRVLNNYVVVGRLFVMTLPSTRLAVCPKRHKITYTLSYWFRGKQLVLFSRESRCFPRQSRGKTQLTVSYRTTNFKSGLLYTWILLYSNKARISQSNVGLVGEWAILTHSLTHSLT